MAKNTIGLIFSVIGMGGLVLSVLSLLPVNFYNIYIASQTMFELLLFEHERTNKEWQDITFSNEAKLFFIFLSGSIVSSLLEIISTVFACCRHSTTHLNRKRSAYEPQIQRKSWFIRTVCFTLILQVLFSLLGTHLIYYLEIDYKVIPREIQYDSSISCIILGINYACLLLFSFILLLASFCILISAHKRHDETRPLIIV